MGLIVLLSYVVLWALYYSHWRVLIICNYMGLISSLEEGSPRALRGIFSSRDTEAAAALRGFIMEVAVAAVRV